MKLKKLNLKLIKDCDHPDIDCRKNYLVKLDSGDFHAGKFSRQWYGLNFDNWGCSGFQLNSGFLKGIWEIQS